MSTSVMTFDRMERDADRTLAFVLWAKHAKNTVGVVFFFVLVNRALRTLIESLSAEKIDTLDRGQAVELTKSLQELHGQLAPLLNHSAVKELARRSVFRSSISTLEEHTADLDDIIEELVLAENKEFRSLLSDCVSSVNSQRRVGNLVKM